ncbi:MAG TPA: VanZ family protein [Polyangiaceae bacterium]|nr:VanZ family protein [Polyangiaceae bacterium]
MPDGPTHDAPHHGATVRGGFVRNVLPALLWALAIFIGGGPGVPQPSIEGLAIPIDKIDHLVAFCGLQVLCFRALRYELPTRSRRGLLWLAALVSVLFGVLLEIYQLGLPDRSAEVADAVADAIGAVLGATVLGFLPWP